MNHVQSKPLFKFKIMDAICAPSCPLRPALRHLVMVLAHLADGHTGRGHHSQETIAKATGQTDRAIRKMLAELAEVPGSPVLVTRRPRFRKDGRGRTSDEYEIRLTGTIVPLEGGLTGTAVPDEGDDLDATNRNVEDDQPERIDTTNRNGGSRDQVFDQVLIRSVCESTPKPRSSSPRKKGKARPWPEDFEPTEKHRALAEKHGLDVELELIACAGHYEGQAVISPNGRFSTWLANSAKFKREAERRTGAPRKGATAVQRGGLSAELLDAARLDVATGS